MNGHIEILPDVAEILEQSTCQEMTVFLPPGQLERKLYERVNKILEALGGKWNRKSRGHVFAYAPQDALDEALTSGYAINQKKALNFFETPYEIAEQLVDEADLTAGMSTLEPSCGYGAIVAQLLKHVKQIDICEIHDTALNHTFEKFGKHHVTPRGGDFLLFQPEDRRYDRIVANPPFSQQQDVMHVSHMLDLLNPGGRVVSVMSAGMSYRDNRLVRDLKEKLTSGFNWDLESLPDGAFKDSGTLVKTVILTATRV